MRKTHLLQEELANEDRQREHEKSKFRIELEQELTRKLRESEMEIERMRQSIEAEATLKFQKLQAEVLERERERDASRDTMRVELNRKLETQANEVILLFSFIFRQREQKNGEQPKTRTTNTYLGSNIRL